MAKKKKDKEKKKSKQKEDSKKKEVLDKKEIDNKEKAPKKSLKKKQNKQLLWAILLMASIIVIVVLVPIVIQNFINEFIYVNLDFQKTKLGDLTFYSTRVPISDKQGEILGTYSMNFRKDPRELQNIDVNIAKEIITFKGENTVYISLDPNMEKCEDNSIAFINLASFLRDFGGLKIQSAVNDKDYALENDLLYADCKNSPDNTIIYVSSGDKTEIKKESQNSNCYELVYSNCEVLDVTERFMIEILDHYMGYFVRA